MNKLKKYTYLLGVALVALATACEDQSEEVLSIDYSRYFAPINLEARVVNRTDVRLTWTPSQGATSYNIELFANDSLTFAGTAALTFDGITADDLPYVISGLEGETQYSARVQAVGEDESKTSKWSGVFFETDAEQILETVTEADLTYNSVTLRWPAGQTATEIVLSPADVPAHTVTSEEIAAGQATITGLKPETEYTAKLMNGNKTRGSQTFTTLIDLAGATAISPEDDFVAILEGAEDGASFAFYPGTYTVPGEEGGVGKLNIKADIELKAVRPSDRPVINGCITLNEGASLSLSQIVMDGQFTTESIENFMLFVPFSILLLWAFQIELLGEFKKIRFGKTVGQVTKIVAVFSFLIEFAQLLFHLGTFQISDLTYNTLGGVIYYIGYKMLSTKR